MKKVLAYFIILLTVFITGFIFNHNFLLPDDSYEFLMLKPDPVTQTLSGHYQFGPFGDWYNVNSVNRAGYGYLISLNADLFTNGDRILAAKSVNWVSLLGIGLLVYEILILFKQKPTRAILGALLTITFSNLLWLSSGVFNDVTGIALLLMSFYLALRNSYKSNALLLLGSCSFLIAASLLRLEYFLGIIPLISILKLNWRKTMLLITGLVVALGAILLPLFSIDWINGQAGIFQEAKLVHVFSILAAILLALLYFKFQKRILSLLALGVALIYLFLPLIAKERFFYDFTMLQFLPVLILLLITGVLFIINHKQDRKALPAAENFGVTALLFAAFYHTYHFHHLVVIFPFACIYLVYLLGNFKLLDKWINLLLGCLIILNLVNFHFLFNPFKEDLPQYLAKKVTELNQKEGGSFNRQNCLIISEYPLELYYWTGISAASKIPANSRTPQYILAINPSQREAFAIPAGYSLTGQENSSFKVDYEMFYQNRPASDYAEFKMYIYERL